MHLDNAAAQRRILLHLADVVEQEQQLTIRRTGNHRKRLAICGGSVEAGVEDFLLLAAGHALRVGLPALAVGRICQHEVERTRRMLIAGQRGAVGDVHGLLAVALEHHVCLGDGVGFGLDFLPEQVDGHLLAVLRGDPVQPILRHRQHTARAACTVITGIGGVLDLIRDGRKHKVSHQLHNVAGRPVLTGFLIVGLVEAAHKLLEDGAHSMVVQTGEIAARLRAEVNVLADKLLDDRAENIGFDHRVDLVSKLELVQNFLHVRRKAVEICFKIRLELLRGWAAGQVAQAEGRSVAESLPSCIA